MIVISDSTTLIILSNLAKLEYLENLFHTVFIPQAVWDEVMIKNSSPLPKFIQTIEVESSDTLNSLQLLLDKGESEAIALAQTKNLPLIIDEKKGRKIAQNLNIKIIGLLGILYLNIKKGHLEGKQVKTFLEEAKKNGYRISQKLINDMFDSL